MEAQQLGQRGVYVCLARRSPWYTNDISTKQFEYVSARVFTQQVAFLGGSAHERFFWC